MATDASGTETTLYVGGLLEKVTRAGSTRWRHYVPTPSGQAILIERQSNNTGSTAFVLTDHLGSGDTLLKANGDPLAKLSFDAFGARRGADWTSATAPDWTTIANSTRRGFTFHEQLDAVGLTHMNGRVYDPALGQFLSVDPLIGNLADSQSVHPYAYVGQRPLSFTDPSGYVVAQGCAAACVEIAKFLIATALSFGLGGSSGPPPPMVLPGQSAQNGTALCGPGSISLNCHGTILYAGAPAAGRGEVPSSSWVSEPTDADYARENLEQFFIDLGVNAVDVLILSPIRDAQAAYAAAEEGSYGQAALLGALVVCNVGSKFCKGFEAPYKAISRLAKSLVKSRRVVPVVARTTVAQVLRNKAAGDAFRDALAADLQKAGRDVATEVYKRTPFGKRFIDIEVSQDGTVLGGIETKVGSSPYIPPQRLKDWWLTNIEGYPVNVARSP